MAAMDFLKFEPTIRQLSLAELRSSVSSKFSRNVRAVIKGWVAGDPDGLVEWALAGGEKHVNFVRHDDPLALFSPLHAIYLGEELGDEAGLRLQEIAISTWASREPEAALSWIENIFPAGDAIEKVHLAGKELADRYAGGRRHSDAALQFADWLEPVDPSRAEDVVAKVAEQALRSGEFSDG